jgi:guanylate kinase
MRDSHELLESAHVHGDHWYGTPRKPVEEAIGSGHDIILEIDYQGARSVRQLFPSDTVLVFVAPPSWGALLDRLHRRHTEHPSQVQRRLASARSEFAHMGMFDYLIVNDCLQQSVDELEAILCAERLKLERAHWQTFQARLLAEADGQNAGGPVGGGGHAQP